MIEINNVHIASLINKRLTIKLCGENLEGRIKELSDDFFIFKSQGQDMLVFWHSVAAIYVHPLASEL